SLGILRTILSRPPGECGEWDCAASVILREILASREHAIAAVGPHVVALIVKLLADDTPERNIQSRMALVAALFLALPQRGCSRVDEGNGAIDGTFARAGFEVIQRLVVLRAVVTENSNRRHAGNVAQIPIRPVIINASVVVISKKTVLQRIK